MVKFNERIDILNKSMIEDYVAVNSERNPIVVGDLDQDRLANVLAQYTLFPANIVNFLYTARDNIRSHGWEEVDIELTRNIGEELGTESKGITHYELLLKGLDQTLGVYLKETSPSESTRNFIGDMKGNVGNENSAFVLGSVYAMECSAIPELEIVKGLIKDLARMKNGNRDLSPLLEGFFTDHIGDWEVGHEAGLRRASQKYIQNESQYLQFENGFKDTMTGMDRWWNGLSREASTQNNFH